MGRSAKAGAGGEHTRRIQMTGNSTFTVSLPKRWANDMNLEKGDPVRIVERGPVLHVQPVGRGGEGGGRGSGGGPDHTRRIQMTGNSTFTVSLPKRWANDMKLEKNDPVRIVERGPVLHVHPGADGAGGGAASPPGAFSVTPWEVKGQIDYDRLVEQFGTERIGDRLRSRLRTAAGEDHFMLRRGVFFSHRDLDRILDDRSAGRPFFLYTGRGPSGRTHVGHLVPWVFAKWLQDRFHARMYFQLTDDEKFFSKPDMSLERATSLAYENALDFAALGFDPAATRIIIDTRDMARLYPVAARVAKRINYSNTRAVFGFTGETNIGMVFYTALQSAPCFIEDAPVLIPLGVDQDPHFRLTRDVAPRLGLPKPALIHNMMMPALQGPGGKMSASDTNGAVYTTDSPSDVRKKINKYAFSGGQPDIATHRRLGGNPDVDVSYQYLRMFFEPSDARLQRIRDGYASGSLTTGELKAELVDRINGFIEGHAERRERAADRLDEYLLDENSKEWWP